MEGNPYFELAGALRGGGGEGGGLCLGVVDAWPSEAAPSRAHRVTVGGNAQERADLLRSTSIGEYGLRDGDTVLALPVEEAQRYVLLCAVVEV